MQCTYALRIRQMVSALSSPTFFPLLPPYAFPLSGGSWRYLDKINGMWTIAAVLETPTRGRLDLDKIQSSRYSSVEWFPLNRNHWEHFWNGKPKILNATKWNINFSIIHLSSHKLNDWNGFYQIFNFFFLCSKMRTGMRFKDAWFKWKCSHLKWTAKLSFWSKLQWFLNEQNTNLIHLQHEKFIYK